MKRLPSGSSRASAAYAFVAAALTMLLAILLGVSGALAQTPSSVFLEDLTWTELQQQIRAGKTTIIVPIGGTEQSGPHMALGKHNVRVKALSERIAVALGNALVAPVIAYVPEGSLSPPTAHMRFAGTITVPTETFQKILEAAARSFRQHGMRDIVFLGDHGGYQKDERAVADRLNREWARSAVRVHAVEEYYRVVQADYVQALKRRGYSDEEIGTHAGLADTSLHARGGRATGAQGPFIRHEAWERTRCLWRPTPVQRRARAVGCRFNRYQNGGCD